MKKLLFLLLLVSGIASAQYTPTGSKTRFVNGIGLGTKSDAAFGTVDSLVLYASADSTLKFKFKGTARALMYAANVGAQIHDSLYAVYQLKAGTSAGARLVSNSGTVVSEWGLGGSANMDFHGFAGYDANRSASYTARSFTDKGYVDSSRALDVQLAGTQTITGAKTFSAILNTGSRLNVNGATDNASYALNVTGVGRFSGAVQANNLYSVSGNALEFRGDNNSDFIANMSTSGMTLPASLQIGSATYAYRQTRLTVRYDLDNDISSAINNQSNTSNARSNLIWAAYGNSWVMGMGSSTSTYGNDLAIYLDATSSTAPKMRWYTNGDVSIASLGTGTVYSNGGIFTNTNPSDSSLKDSIMPLRYGLAEVLKLKPKTFYYKSDSAHTMKYGFIAQEVKPIMPDVVRKISKNTDKLGLETDGIYVTLVKAIQEQQAIIDDLKKRIIQLENK